MDRACGQYLVHSNTDRVLDVSQIRLHDSELPELFSGLFVFHIWVNNNVLAWSPVNRRGHLVIIVCLKGIDDAQDFGGGSPGGGRVGLDNADVLRRIDHEDGADSERHAVRINIGRVLVIEPNHPTERHVSQPQDFILWSKRRKIGECEKDPNPHII